MNFRPLSVLGAAVTTAALLLAAPLGAAASTASASTASRHVASESDPSTDESSAQVTWALRPAANGEADGRVSLRHTVDPGAGIDESVVLTNFGSQQASFAVYAGDGAVSGSGSFDLAPPEEGSEDAGAWVALGAVEGASARPEGGLVLTLGPESSVVIPVRVDVPSDAGPGDHPAGIVAELLPGAQQEVLVASRIGVRLHLRVSGDVIAGARPDVVEATYQPSWNPFAPGTLTLRYDLVNTGNVRIGAESIVRASGPFGALGVDAAPEVRREILPGDSSPAEVSVLAWPLFVTEVRTSVRPASVGDDVIDGSLDATSATVTVWTIPWAQLILVVGAVLLVLAARHLRLRSAVRTQARIDEAVAAARAEAQTEE
ncbi:hypothetical protein ACI3KS_16525 [Microbacterium sp. ZW T5_45]|uniref:COG1470 family protein n=1 Tax=Microbacterium sp. ZW T5_45 TaxID=3378080 RepID=UPI00385313BE